MKDKTLKIDHNSSSSPYSFDMTPDTRFLALGHYQLCFISVHDLSKIISDTVKAGDPKSIHLSTCRTPQEEDEMNTGNLGDDYQDASVSRVMISPCGRFVLSLADVVEPSSGHGSIDAVVRLHSVSDHDLHPEHNHNYATVIEAKNLGECRPLDDIFIRHMGFNQDGTKFFISTHKEFLIYDMSEFAPRLTYTEQEILLSLAHTYELSYCKFETEEQRNIALNFIETLGDHELQKVLKAYFTQDIKQPGKIDTCPSKSPIGRCPRSCTIQ